MTNPTQHGQVPEALIDLIDTYAETRHRCGGTYNAKTEAARKAVIEALSGVQALSAAPAEQQVASSAVLKAIREANMQLVRTGDDEFMLVPYKVATTGAALGVAPGVTYANKPDAVAWLAEYGGDVFTSAQLLEFADRTHALRMEQAAPKAAPTWPSEALVWEALQAYLKHDTNMEGMRAALIVGAAPQQEAQEPYAYAVYFPDQPNVELVHELDDLIDDLTNRPHVVTKLYTAPQPAPAPLSRDQIREVFMAHGFTIKEGQTDLKQYVYDAAQAIPGVQWQCGQQASGFAAPQPAPAPLSERDAFEKAYAKQIGMAPTRRKHHPDLYMSDEANTAWRWFQVGAALAAQGGKDVE